MILSDRPKTVAETRPRPKNYRQAHMQPAHALARSVLSLSCKGKPSCRAPWYDVLRGRGWVQFRPARLQQQRSTPSVGYDKKPRHAPNRMCQHYRIMYDVAYTTASQPARYGSEWNCGEQGIPRLFCDLDLRISAGGPFFLKCSGVKRRPLTAINSASRCIAGCPSLALARILARHGPS